MKTKTENKSFIRAWKLNMRALRNAGLVYGNDT